MTPQDSLISYGTAMINQPVNLAVAFLVALTYGWIWNNTEHPVIEFGFWSQIVLYTAIDFLFYWFHRLGHRTNFFWAAHGLHHTGEEMNLAIALRTSVTQRLFSFLFYWPLLLIGFSPKMIYFATGIHLLLGYWHHTRFIGKLGTVFEYFFNSPSHHRVHHGINPRYIDKNYGEILIIWDRMFGTYEEETEEPVYGSLSPPRTWNPIKLNLQHWVYMKDAIKATNSWKEKILLPFMPPEWVPPTIDSKFIERNKKQNATWNNFEKYQTVLKPGVLPYLITQVVTGFTYTMLAVTPQTGMATFEVVTVSICLWLMAISWSKLLESTRDAAAFELFRMFAFGCVVFTSFTHYKIEFLLVNAAGGLLFYVLHLRRRKDLNLGRVHSLGSSDHRARDL